MSTQSTPEHGMTPEQVADLEAWAEAGDFAPVPRESGLHGEAAREAGRAMMEAAGVDVEALERSRVGRPSLSPGAKPGSTSPMWHLRAPEDLNAAARARAEAEGRDLSSLVRDAVQAYLAAS